MVYGKQAIYWPLFYIPQTLCILKVAYILKLMQQFKHLFQDTIWFGKVKQPMVYGSKIDLALFVVFLEGTPHD